MTEPPQTLFDATTSLFGEEKGEKGAAPLTLQSRCEEGKMRVLIGLQVHGIPEISTLPSGPFIVDHAIEFSKPRVRVHYTALYNVEMADNGVEPRTSNSNHANIPNAHTPCCQLASVILRVCSIAHRGNWVASVALDLLCDRAYSFANQDKSSCAAVSCSLAIERVQSRTELLW